MAPDTDQPAETPAVYDPADYTVDEVLEHLEEVDADEVQRIYDAEVAGKNRTTLVEKITLPIPGPEQSATGVAEPIRAGGHVLVDDVGWVPETYPPPDEIPPE